MKQKGGKSVRKNRAPNFLHKLVVMVSAFFVFLVFSVVAALAALWILDRPPNPETRKESLFTIAKGEAGLSVTRRLLEGRFIKSEIVFRSLMKLKNYDNALKAGNYRIAPDMPGSEILELFVSGKQVLESIRIPEGTVLGKAARIIEDSGVASSSAFLAAAKDISLLKELGIEAASAEGYLFPETYFFARDSDAKEVIRVMVKTFFTRLAEAVPEYSSLSAKELFDKVTLASIIEREYQVPEEAPRMAGVFYNRLRIGMPLQSCATVVFIITEKMGKPHPSRLFDKDIQIDNPYNTYVHQGLPPSPIGNPGITALKAVMRPESTNYLYFRLIDGSSGKHYFSETLDQHIKAASLIVKQK